MTPPNADRAGITYRRYLRLPDLLAAQAPLTDAHDEMLFITIHQASELWMKLVLHELRAARARVARDDVAPALKMLARVSKVQAQLIQSWEVLSTMTPSDYGRMRGALGASSGFQSDQYRRIEFILGNRNARAINVFEEESVRAGLAEELRTPSLYDEAVRLLSRRGFAIPRDTVERDPSTLHAVSTEVERAWARIYAAPEEHWDLYDLAEKLVDLEYHFQIWRFSHLKTVERVIGFKAGTGGTVGVGYLAKVIEQRFFPELIAVRTSL